MENIRLPVEDIEKYIAELTSIISSSQHFISLSHLFQIATNNTELFNRILPFDLDFITSTPIEEFRTQILDIINNKKDPNWNVFLLDHINHLKALPLSNIPNESYYNETFKDGFKSFNTNDQTRMRMSRKKIHEVDRLSKLIISISTQLEIDLVIDIGSGKGYLSHEIGTKIPVIGIESEQRRNEEAKKRFAKMDYSLKTSSRIELVTGYANKDNILELIQKGKSICQKATPRTLLVGLHSCGDLSAKVMNDCIGKAEIQGVVSVGCCYHLMNLQTFPQSKLIKTNGIKLTKKDLQCASHTFQNFTSERLRSLWETQAKEAKMKYEQGTGFDWDNEKRIYKDAPNVIPVDAIDVDLVEKRIAFISLLKSLVGPLIETLVLLDRYYYNKDMGLETFLLPLFDRDISTRSFVFCAFQIQS